jgi:DNA-directed RNA polymerase subunit RPC12/RpoP
MAIKPVCDKCGKELTEFGAILLSPPDQENNVKKLHLCKECYHKIVATFDV